MSELQDEEKFRQIYERQIEMVYRICYLLLQNRADAEDAAQGVFLKLWERKKTFQDLNHEKAWLITVSRNHCRDILRSPWHKKRIAMEDVIGEYADTEKTGERELLSAVMELPAKYREAVYLYYYEGYSIREMSGILHRKESTIQSRLAAARKKLKQLL